MKKLYFLDEQEKNRILNLHTEATKKQYLGEKKIITEVAVPEPRQLWKAINLIFKKGPKGGYTRMVGMGDELLDLAKTSPKTYNYKVIEALDDALAAAQSNGNKLDDYLLYKTKPDGSLISYMKDSGGNTIELDKILKMVQDNFPKGINDNITDEKITKLLSGIPDEVVSFTNPSQKLDLKSLWKTELQKMIAKPFFPGMPNLSGLQKVPGLLFATKSRGFATLTTAYVGLRNIYYNFVQSGSGSRKQISKSIDELINQVCSGDTYTEELDEVILPSMEKTPAQYAQKLLDAGIGGVLSSYVDTGTDNETIRKTLLELKDYRNFCKVSYAFYRNHSEGFGSTSYKSRGYNRMIVNYFDYEFSGTNFVGADDVEGYQDSVKEPLKKILKNFVNSVEKFVEKSEPTSDVKSTSDGSKPIKSSTYPELDKLFKDWPEIDIENFKCLVNTYKSYGGEKKVISKRENPMSISKTDQLGIQIGNKIYGGDHLMYENNKATGKSWKCDGNNIVEY